LECLRRLGGTLIQTMQYGTPLSSALRVLSGDLRLETLTKFEERAARLPVLLTVPMILFILPCVFLVVGGPAVIQMMKALR
jgi:tight adherence protein C